MNECINNYHAHFTPINIKSHNFFTTFKQKSENKITSKFYIQLLFQSTKHQYFILVKKKILNQIK